MTRELRIATDGPVVMVDDNDSDIVLARFCYEDAKVPNRFIGMHSGQELLEYLESVHKAEAAMPAIVLLDINMPGMNGFEVLARLRARDEFKSMPIIMMLTHSDYPEDMTKAHELGANGFQTKPFLVKEYVEFFGALRPQ
jgi:CheY-like chemotaxis protein